MTTVVRVGSRAVRPVTPEAGRAMVLRSAMLAGNGIRTPVAEYDAGRGTLSTPWIPGTSGRERLRAVANGSEADHREPYRDLLAGAMRALVLLHRVPAEDLGLAPLDPWRNIRGRLVRLEESRDEDEAVLRARAHSLEEVLDGSPWLTPSERGAACVHGDFHTGQLVFDASGAWILDLLDLALGPPESDVANFCAHLATSGPRPSASRYRETEALCSREYQRVSATGLDSRRLRAHGALALLRRGLKIRERGEPRDRVQEVLEAAWSVAVSHPEGTR